MPQISRKEEYSHENEEDDELSEIQPAERNIYTKIQNFAESFAATRIGQFFICRGDRILRSVETTAKWSLPVDQNKMEQTRPLPWIPFLFLLLVLRVFRFWLSLGALFIGNNPVTPHDMVYFIQTRRRKLRSIRLHGLRALKQRQIQTNGRNLLQKFSKTLLTAVCCSGRRQQQLDANLLLLREHWCSEHAKLENPITSTKKRTVCQYEEELEDQNLSFEEKLAKYADQPSDEDSDFVPDLEETTDDDDDDCTTSSDSDVLSIDEEETMSQNTDKEKCDLETEKTKKKHKVDMPKPFIIKSEPYSENENVPTRTNGKLEDIQEHDVMEKETHRDNDEKKNTATKTKIKPPLMLNSTAAAGSPTAFNEFMPTFNQHLSNETLISDGTIISTFIKDQQQQQQQPPKQHAISKHTDTQQKTTSFHPIKQPPTHRNRNKNRRKLITN